MHKLVDRNCKLGDNSSMNLKKGEKMVKISVPAGRYFIGDVSGLSRPLVAIPARSSVFYDDSGCYEIEIAGGGHDENAFGIFGVIEFEKTGLDEFGFELYGFELESETEIIFDFDYLEIVGVMKFSVCRDAGLTFTALECEFE
jgi:hypothetical protein